MAPPGVRPVAQQVMPSTKKLLIISNGHGEDAIAAQIVGRLPPGFAVEAYPTLGDGLAYRGICPIVGPRAQLPSEGWRNVKHSVARDIGGEKRINQHRASYGKAISARQGVRRAED